ncbi:hypothetical protein G9A89_003909 [Geosiphon pyriformis]|nr:hypothetical protein G9A89_003909 [Geosiphon pyriformis]
MNLKAASSSDMSKKKASKGTLYGSADGFFSQKKKIVLGNVKHSGNERDISLVKLGSSGMYSDMDSESSCGKDNMILEGVNNGSLLDLAATTSKAKRVDSNMVFGSLLGSPNYDMNKKVELLLLPLDISLEKKWINPKIVKTSVEVSVRKFFALDINFLAVEDKFATAKTQFIRKIFSTKSLIKTILLARKKGIIINSDLKKQGICSDWAIVIKEILMDMSKKIIITTVFEFGNIKSIKIQLIGMWQKAVVEFTELEQAKQLASRWSFFIGKDSVHVTMTVGDCDTWMSRDHFRAFLFTLPVGTTVHDLSTLLEEADEKTCVINHSLETGNQIHCAIVGFESENKLDFAFYTEPIFGGIKLSWARLDLVQCEKCGRFGHSALECNASDTLVSALSKKSYKRTASDKNHVWLARLYAKKNVFISCPTAFGGKSWAQIVSSAFSSGGLLFESGFGSGSFSSGASSMGGGFPLALTNNSFLNACLLSLECSLELLSDQMSGILHKLNSIELVSLVFPSSSNSLVTLINVKLDSNSDIVLESFVVVPAPLSVVSVLRPSSSKILMTKVGCLESKLVAFEASIGSVLVKLDQFDLIWKFTMCNVKSLNVLAKQDNIIWWHISLGNMIIKKFDGMRIFTFELEKSFLGAGVTVIMNKCLAWHIFKVEEISSLYASTSTESKFSQASVVNSLIAKAVNSSMFVVLNGNFNKNRKGKSVNVKFCSDLGLIKRTIDFIFISCNLSSTVVGHKISSVVEFFNTDYWAVLVLIGLGGLVDSDLNSLYKQANRNKWKFRIKDADAGKGLHFREYLFDRFAIVLPKFNLAKDLGNLDTIDFECMKNKYSSKFFRLELLVAKIVKSLSLGCTVNFAHFLHTWSGLDETEASEFETLINNNVGTEVALQHLTGIRKRYCKSKYYEFRIARDNFIRKTIDKHIENLNSDKRCMIRSVLDWPVRKVVFNYLIINDNLILDPRDIKSNIDMIIEEWMRKCMVPEVLSDHWLIQYAPLAYIDSSVFTGVMSDFSLDKLLVVVNDLLNGKTTELSGITNKLVLSGLLEICNMCLTLMMVPTLWKKAWVSMIPKPYEWEVLSKLLSDRISLAYSKFDVFQGDNFSVLRGMSTLSPIFAVGLVVEDALEKGREVWLVLQDILNRIKMCPCFVKFFENIYNGQVNHVMTDFGLMSGYTIHDRLDQKEVFSLLLWKIFYDSLLCKVKKFGYAYDYKIEFRFFTCTGKPDFGSNKMSFMAVEAFVDNTIWIGNSLTATQSILNIASEFFCVNNISINADKTVAIPINKKIVNSWLVISESSITIAKKCETHRYLDIFLSTEGLFHPSIAKAHLNLKFFMNLVLRKVVSDKQFLYLVSAVLQSIISYRLQFSHVPISVYEKWDKLLRKGLKLKTNLPKYFPTEAFYHPDLYNMVSFRQLLAENLLANFVSFVNFVDVLGDLFKHHAMDLQAISNPVNCFLTGVMNTLSLCGLFLGSSATNIFCVSSGVAAADVFGLDVYMKVSGGLVGSSDSSYFPSSKFFSYNTSYIRDCLKQVSSDVISIYTNSLVKDFGSSGASDGTAAYFPSADISVDVRVLSLLSLTLVEMQTITLALDCVPSHSLVVLFTDSQALLDLCCEFICETILSKNLLVIWNKIKDHVGVVGNKRANFFASAATSSSFILSVKMSHHFFSIKGRLFSGNACHMARRLYEAVNFIRWKFKYTSDMVDESLSSLINKYYTFNVWHTDGWIRSGYMNSTFAMLHLYFIKALYYQLLVAKRKRLYNLDYSSVLCIHCRLLEDSDHIFVCVSNVNTYNDLILKAITDWTILLGVHTTCSVVVCSLCEAVDLDYLYMSLSKDFMFKDWVAETKWFLGIESNNGSLVVDLICHFAENHRSSIWLPRTKLKAHYKKHGLLPYNRSIVPLVIGLSLVWFCGMIHIFGIKLGIYTCFSFHPHLNSMQFGFLCDFLVAGVLNV